MKNPLSKLDLKDKKTVLLILICIIVLYFDFNFVIKLQIQGLKSAGPKIIRLKKDIDALNKDLASVQDLTKKQMETKQKLAAKQKKIISEGQVASLLQLISDTANKNAISINEMKPFKEAKAKGDKALGALKSAPLLITLSLSGDYPGFGSFLNDLENSEIFMVMQELKVTPQDNNYLKQKANMVLMTYVKK